MGQERRRGDVQRALRRWGAKERPERTVARGAWRLAHGSGRVVPRVQDQLQRVLNNLLTQALVDAAFQPGAAVDFQQHGAQDTFVRVL